MKKLTLGLGALVLGFSIFAAPSAQAAGQASLPILYMTDIHQGTSGAAAAELQAFLGEQGYFTLPLGVSFGYFGPITRTALVRVQTANGLIATGIFDQQTRNAVQVYMLSHCWLGSCQNR